MGIYFKKLTMHKILDVTLNITEDPASGIYGAVRLNDLENGFNTFWNGIGIFHDVFEHYFEGEHKYFRGRYSYNICGEMVAMGKALYFYDILGNAREVRGGFGSFYDVIRRTTYDEVSQAIQYGYISFGDKLLSKIPYQSPIYESDLEYQIKKFYDDAKILGYRGEKDYDGDRAISMKFKQSVTFQNIANPHRYGYRTAQRMIENSWHNVNQLRNFIAFWNNFCKRNNAESVSYEFNKINVKVHKDKNKDIYCSAYLINSDEGIREKLNLNRYNV